MGVGVSHRKLINSAVVLSKSEEELYFDGKQETMARRKAIP